MLNGLIGEADSLLKAVLEILDEHFTKSAKECMSKEQSIGTK